MGDLGQACIGAQHRFTRGPERETRGAVGARQRRGDGAVDAHIGQTLAEQRRLTLAHLRQRDVLLPLVPAFGVPRRFAVAGEQDSHRSDSVFWGQTSLAKDGPHDGRRHPEAACLRKTALESGVPPPVVRVTRIDVAGSPRSRG